MAKLVVLTQGLAGTTYELKGDRTTVGRMEDNAFQVAEPSVSSHHCEILLNGTEIIVRDLNSTNGTYINGQVTKEGALKPGQILRIGQVEMRLENGAPASGKKQLDHTVTLTGVKASDLEQTARPVGSPFAKKSDSANKLFLYVGIGLAALIVIFILSLVVKM